MADIKKIKIGNDELDVTKKQDKIDSTHKLSADLVNDSSSTHKFTTAADISKLSGIEAGAEVNVQSDWSQKTTTADDYIKNKPTIGNATLTIQKNSKTIDTFTANATSNKTINIPIPTTAADVSALPSSTKYGASISVSVNSTDYKITTTLKDQDGNTLGTAQVIDLPLESVVVSGSFDSTNKKIILTLQNGNTVDIPVGDLVAGLQTEITSENKLDSDLVDDTNQAHKFMTAAERTKLSGIATGAEVNVQSDWNVTNNTSDAFIKNKPTLATVATSGSYNDLSNKPTIPTVNNATLTIQKNGTTVKTFTANASSNVTANITVPTKTSDITNDSNFVASGDLAAVATSGSYNDLSNKPTIPTVNNGTLTIQKNGSTVKTFTANASSNVTANITVPTSTSELTNDSGFIDEIPVASAGTLGGIKVGNNLSIDASGVLSADAESITVDSALSTSSQNPVQNSVITTALNGKNKTIWTANNLSPAANTPASWKTLLGGDGIYYTWYDTANKFTNQPGTYGFLMTIVRSSDMRQEWWMQTSGKHYYRTGNGKGWYGQSGNAGSFKYLGENLDSALSTTSINPVQNKVVTNALNDKANSADLATVATSGSYNDLSNKPTIPTAGTITSGSTGYATGGDVYNAIGDVESILTALNNGGGAQ